MHAQIRRLFVYTYLSKCTFLLSHSWTSNVLLALLKSQECCSHPPLIVFVLMTPTLSLWKCSLFVVDTLTRLVHQLVRHLFFFYLRMSTSVCLFQTVCLCVLHVLQNNAVMCFLILYTVIIFSNIIYVFSFEAINDSYSVCLLYLQTKSFGGQFLGNFYLLVCLHNRTAK